MRDARAPGMDDLDRRLLDAWTRVRRRLRDHVAFAEARAARQRRVTRQRVPLDVCVGVRASDTRIDPARDFVCPDDAVDRRVEHEVDLAGARLRALCAPVSIPWPGVDAAEAAAILGVDPDVVRRRVRDGRLGSRSVPASAAGKRGQRVAMVWTRGPAAPWGAGAAGPHPWFGSAWQLAARSIPDGYVLPGYRVPRWRPEPQARGGVSRFRGWDWLCPGLPAERPDGTVRLRGCGRRCLKLYLPMGGGTNLLAAWTGLPPEPGNPTTHACGEPTASPGTLPPFRGFACATCWRIERCRSMRPTDAWNRFVTHISGGWTTGREVGRTVE